MRIVSSPYANANPIGSRVIHPTGFLRTASELEGAGKLSLEYPAMHLRKSPSSEPTGCFVENSVGCSTVSHPKQAAPRVEL